MSEQELRFQAIKEAQLFITANRDRYSFPSFYGTKGMSKTVVNVADFMLAYADGTHEDYMKEHTKGEDQDYPLPLPPNTADNTETAPLSRAKKFKGKNK